MARAEPCELRLRVGLLRLTTAFILNSRPFLLSVKNLAAMHKPNILLISSPTANNADAISTALTAKLSLYISQQARGRGLPPTASPNG